MKTALTFLFAVMIAFTTLIANTNPTDVAPVPNEFAEQPALFLGDNNLVQAWLVGEVVYPAVAMNNAHEGQVVMTFTIDKNGQPKDFVIVQGIGQGCEEAVIAAIQRMPRWKPARANGQNVPVSLTVAFDFIML